MRLSFGNKGLRGGPGTPGWWPEGPGVCKERGFRRAGEVNWKGDIAWLLKLFLKRSSTPTAHLSIKVHFWFWFIHLTLDYCRWTFITEEKRIRRVVESLLWAPFFKTSYWRTGPWGMCHSQSRTFEVRETGIGVFLVPLVYCVTLSKFFALSEPLFPHL